MRHQQKSGGKIALNLGKKLFLKIGGEVPPPGIFRNYDT